MSSAQRASGATARATTEHEPAALALENARLDAMLAMVSAAIAAARGAAELMDAGGVFEARLRAMLPAPFAPPPAPPVPEWAEREADARAPAAKADRDADAGRLVSLANAHEWAKAQHRVARSGLARDIAAAHVATLAAEVERLKGSL